jgi:hypothetical protein
VRTKTILFAFSADFLRALRDPELYRAEDAEKGPEGVRGEKLYFRILTSTSSLNDTSAS